VPTTFEDFQLLLDNDDVMKETPILGELSADNYFLNNDYWILLNTVEKNAYTWNKDIYEAEVNIGDWNFSYKQVFYANVILNGLDNMPSYNKNTREWNTFRGSALFIRGYAFYNLAQVFAPVYDEATANALNSGIPLRMTPNIDEPTRRSTVSETYEQILADLEEASRLLPDTISYNYRNRPSRPAALALLARVHLSMRSYEEANKYANSCLLLYNTLMDYNDRTFVNPNATRPFEKRNPETMYQSVLHSHTNVLLGNFTKDCIIDSGLYKSYSVNDLRKTAFFAINNFNQPYLKGTYNGTNFMFSGMATDEMYIIKAECSARAGRNDEAINTINTLLFKRFRTGTFVPYTTSTVGNVLDFVLSERRKELPFRGVRWSDLRRLNKEGHNIKVKRILNTQSYELLPNSSKYVLPIPTEVITLTGIPQNIRN
jgi:hypothetical protein